MKWYHTVLLICISLTINDVDHLFMFVAQSCIFFGEMSNEVFAHILIELSFDVEL